jgi:hypothetical protein
MTRSGQPSKPVHLHVGIVVLTAVSHRRGCRGRRYFVVGTREPVPIGRHRRVITFNVDAFGRNYVMAELRSRIVIAASDRC